MEKGITKYDQYLAEMDENIRFYLNTPERFAEALIFAKKLKKFAENIEEKVKNRGAEIMMAKDLRVISFGGFDVSQIDATTTNEYSVSDLVDAVGIEIAMPLMKVNTSKLEFWMKKSKLEGEILEKINRNKKIKPRKGYIRLAETKNNDGNNQ